MQKLKAIFTNKDLMKKVLFTLLAFAIYRVAVFIKLPLINADLLFAEGDLFGFLDAFSGGALKNFSIIALGISPYITASIVVQFLQMDFIPILKEWSEEGDAGKQKLSQLTRYLAIGMAFVQALALTIGFSTTYKDALFEITDINFFTYIYLAFILTAGTAFLLWLADQITLKGVGNGSSMIIVAGIISSMPLMFNDLLDTYVLASTATLSTILIFFGVILLMVLILVAIIYMQATQRKIPIQYANRSGANAFRGKNESNIPIKLNSAGVIPVIFAATIMSLPRTLVGFIENTTLSNWMTEIFYQQRPIGFILYVILIYVFAFFYSFLTINPEKIANNLSKQNAYIPGIRPGNETEVHISRVLFRITLLGATYLVIVAILPIITAILFDLPQSVQIGGTSLLIVVGVAVQTAKQLETESQSKQYTGFIK